MCKCGSNCTDKDDLGGDGEFQEAVSPSDECAGSQKIQTSFNFLVPQFPSLSITGSVTSLLIALGHLKFENRVRALLQSVIVHIIKIT